MFQPLVSLNKALLGPYFLRGGGIVGVPLGSHEPKYLFQSKYLGFFGVTSLTEPIDWIDWMNLSKKFPKQIFQSTRLHLKRNTPMNLEFWTELPNPPLHLPN